jgi:hypothetical protein
MPSKAAIVFILDLHAVEELHENDEVKHQGSSKEGILACVVDRDNVLSATENVAIVFIEGALRIAYARDVLDDDAVVWVLVNVQDWVSTDHVIDNGCLRDLL